MQICNNERAALEVRRFGAAIRGTNPGSVVFTSPPLIPAFPLQFGAHNNPQWNFHGHISCLWFLRKHGDRSGG